MKKLLSTAMALVLIIGLLTGCSVESQGEKTESVSNQYYLYYLNKDETKVTRTRYYPEQESAEFMLQDLMGILNGQGEQRREPAFASSRSSAGDLPFK